VRVVLGDLNVGETAATALMGISQLEWSRLCEEVDVIVHWLLPYSAMSASNVASTLACIQLAESGRRKRLAFVSSTSVMDSPHYRALASQIARAGHQQPAGQGSAPTSASSLGGGLRGISESDTQLGSATGLSSGYGQTKWVSGQLVLAAWRMGVAAVIVRPGYILGDSHSGASNPSDFLWRLAKGCAALKLTPVIDNAINACPVDYVAGAIVAAVEFASAGGSASPPMPRGWIRAVAPSTPCSSRAAWGNRPRRVSRTGR